MDAKRQVCQIDKANGEAPEIAICGARHGTEHNISPKPLERLRHFHPNGSDT